MEGFRAAVDKMEGLWPIDYEIGSRGWNSGKSIFEIRIPNFYYIEVIDFDLSYLFHNFHGIGLAKIVLDLDGFIREKGWRQKSFDVRHKFFWYQPSKINQL